MLEYVYVGSRSLPTLLAGLAPSWSGRCRSRRCRPKMSSSSRGIVVRKPPRARTRLAAMCQPGYTHTAHAAAKRLRRTGNDSRHPGPGPSPANSIACWVSVSDTASVADVLVVDDASEDDTPVRRVAARNGALFVGPAIRGGSAAARNTGPADVTTPLVAFLDSDVVVRPGWLTTLTAHLAGPLVAMSAPRVTALSTPDPSAIAIYETHRSALSGPGPSVAASSARYLRVAGCRRGSGGCSPGTGCARSSTVPAPERNASRFRIRT